MHYLHYTFLIYEKEMAVLNCTALFCHFIYLQLYIIVMNHSEIYRRKGGQTMIKKEIKLNAILQCGKYGHKRPDGRSAIGKDGVCRLCGANFGTCNIPDDAVTAAINGLKSFVKNANESEKKNNGVAD